MIVSHFPHGPTVYFTLNNVSLRHDIGNYKSSTVSEQYPHLIFENFTSQLGERVRDVLKYLFPVPKEDSKRVMTFSNEDDFISFRLAFLVSCLKISNTVSGTMFSSKSLGKCSLQRLVRGLT
jgi:U3 small nucleolar ribonucleoprotein protein IMP4